MARNQTASAPAREANTQPSIRSAGKQPAYVPSAPVPIREFDIAVHRKEIAQVAYRIWLERADRQGSPEEDWLKAESEVRAKYTR